MIILMKFIIENKKATEKDIISLKWWYTENEGEQNKWFCGGNLHACINKQLT